MKTYEFIFKIGNNFHSNLIKTEKEISDIEEYCKSETGKEFIDLKEATPDSYKPGKPIIVI